jgi:YebC/PmpR family DNA-binding regulatory protein
MSGHSKWATIKRKKAVEDAKRGKAFTKLVREMTIVARDGGGDPAGNPRLRLLVDKAKEINMPQENIIRAIKKGTGELPGTHYEAVTYEGYAPHGIAVMLDILTDNKNRTAAEMRRLFSSHSGSLADVGSVSWMFDHLGVVRLQGKGTSEDALLEMLVAYAVIDIWHDDGIFAITCEPKDLFAIKKKLEESQLTVESAQLEWVSKSNVELSPEQAEKVYNFLEVLDDHDDIQNVYSTIA